jgi:dihydroorotase
LDTFDTNYKLLPPLRTQKDIKALLKGLSDGTIDGVTSDHDPIDVEHKITEFDHAHFGSIGLESCFGALCKATNVELAVEALTRLRKVFGLPHHPITEGTTAQITLFDPDVAYTFSEKDIISSSKNAAFVGSELKGKAYGICANKKLLVNE